ncbi:MAG: hypothetical protein AAGM22_14445 [Acidobacteriota bacterium]
MTRSFLAAETSRGAPSAALGVAVLFALCTGTPQASADAFEVVATERQNPTRITAEAVMHPSGRFYYQASSDGVAVMAADPDGGWRFEQMLGRRAGDGAFLGGFDLEIAANGRHLYMLAGDVTARSLVTLEIAPETGRIQPVQVLDGDLGSGLGTGFFSGWAIALSPGGDRLLATSGEGLIWVLSIDGAGRLAFLRQYDFSDDPDWDRPVVARGLRFDAANGWLYVVNNSRVLRYAWHEGTADILKVGEPTLTTALFPNEPINSLFDFQLSVDGRTAFAALQGSSFGAIVRATLGEDGEWTPGPSTRLSLDRMSLAADPERGLAWVQGEIDEALFGIRNGVRALRVDAAGQFEVVQDIRSRDRAQPGRQAIILGLDGQNLFVPNFENRGVTVFDTPSAEGTAVSPKQEPVSGLRDVLDIAITADGRFIYTASSTENGIGLFERVGDEIVWRAEFLERNLGSEERTSASQLYLSPDERFLYLRSLRRDGSVASSRLLTFERDLVTGGLSLIDDFFLDGGTFAFSPDGRHGYMAGRLASEVYSRSSATGLLTEIPAAASRESSDRWVFEPRGDLLYSITSTSFAEAEVYRRDPNSGFIQLQEELDIGDLSRATRIEISEDSRFQYFVTSTGFVGIGRIAVIERDLARNSHGLIQTVTGLVTPLPLASEFFYDLALDVTGRRAFYGGDRGVGWIDRDPETGLLSPRSGFERDRGSRARVVRMAPQGGEIYAYYPDLGELEVLRPACQPALGACLNDDRFQVEVEWRDSAGNEGRGTAVPVAAGAQDSSLMWFFEPSNWEFVVKVLDGCSFNQHFWVFASAATDVEYTLTITDVRSGIQARYFHELGSSAPAITDTSALAVCP